MPTLTELIHLAKALVRRDAFHGALESPRIGASISDTIVISGWTFSRRAPVERIEAFVGPVSLGPLPYGVERPDVARAFPRRDVARCGYATAIRLHPSIKGRQTLIVRVTDRAGQITEYYRAVAIRIPFRDPASRRRIGSATIEVERAIWGGRTLLVEGWAIWPGATPPLSANIRLAEFGAGSCRASLSRPDVAERFETEPAAARSGFRLVATLPEDSHNAPHRSEAQLHVDLRDAAGHRCRHSTPIRHDVELERAARAWTHLEAVVASHRSQHGRPALILDWKAGLVPLGLGALPVYSPSFLNGTVGLPYADRSIDIVVTNGRQPQCVSEAIRVASKAAVVIDGARVETVWAAPDETARSPRVSIIIPVRGQIEHTESCLRQLDATLGSEFTIEIIVVDDASTDSTPARLKHLAARDQRVGVLTNDRNVGFLESCNRAALAATGEVLVFLNNDTLPQPGWLPPLIESLRDRKAGAVGAKLVYPDGSLQEAGGVTFADATGWNFGKGDPEPAAPIFNHVREVDYCSAAALATPRRLFLDLGGFDRRFAPAYYEDTDYCFTLRAGGYRVLYQPASIVVHTEGATSGIDERFGIKSAQAANRITFAAKWRDALRAQPEPPPVIDRAALYRLAVRDSRTRRALVWAPKVPEHDRESGSRRVYDTICYLRDAGWAVTFVAESATGGERYVSMLEQMGVTVYAGKDTSWAGAAYLPDATELLTLGAFDIAILHFWWLARRHLQSLRHWSPSTRVIVDSVDLEFVRRARSRELAREPAVSGLSRTPGECGHVDDDGDATAMRRELDVYAAADGVLAVSAREAGLINELVAGSSRAHVVPDAEDLPQSRLDFDERRGLLFVANCRHPPNVEALAYLASEIVPRLPPELLVRHPISLVGTDLTDAIVDRCGARLDGLQLVGWVPSIEPYLERARATIVPLRNGAGTKRKLIQAAMMGTPSVSTSVGVEGMSLCDGEHVIVADDPGAFADAVVTLIDDERLWRRLAAAGREAACAAHGREIVRARFHAVVDHIMQSAANNRSHSNAR